ncbi:MAG: histidine phosphatase family protein, partial [Patescibacteria group bacterium]
CGHTHTIGSLGELDDLDQAPTTLVVMRHGEVPHNVKGLVNPVSAENDRRDVLTAKGKRQALAAAKKLKKERIDVIVSSPSFRTRENAKIVAHELGISSIHTIQELRDVAIGPFEGKPIAEFKKEFADFSERFWEKPGGAENLREVRARVMKAAAIIRGKYSGKKILVLTHGDPSWILMAALEGMPEDKYAGAHYLKPAEFKTVRLHSWPYDTGGEVNLHKPYVDEVRLKCTSCGKTMRRVSEVVDAWFDSGAMPFAQAHYPFAWAQNQKSKIKNQKEKLLYPADYICEGVDQTRGWFYTLLAVSTLLGRGASYKNVISLGHVLDKNGQKMSKSKGNIVEPFPMVEKYGADTIRWYFYTVNAPGDPKRFDEKDLLLKLRGPIATFWNSFVFFDTYINKIQNSTFVPSSGRGKFKIQNSRNVLDQWVLARLDELTQEVTVRLNDYDIVGAARLLETFIVEDFSNWYLRRSRRRFQKPESTKEKDEAALTMAYALVRLVELMAPFTPFLAEIIYQ